VQFPLLDLFYFPLFLISFYSHHILLALRTSFILAFSAHSTISLYILKLYFPLISHTNGCIRNKGVNISDRHVNALLQYSNCYYDSEHIFLTLLPRQTERNYFLGALARNPSNLKDFFHNMF